MVERVDEASPGDRVAIVLGRTPFYAEAGGQVGDSGVIEASDGGRVRIDDTQTVGLTLLHVAVADRLGPDVLRGVPRGYHDRYDEIRDAVCETEPSLRDDLLSALPVEDLLIESVGSIADRLRL